jgi:hypothetical protein
VDAPRHTAAGLEQRLDGDLAASGRVEAGDRPHARGVQRLEHDRLPWLEPRERRGLLTGGQDESRCVPTQRGPHLHWGAVGVVDHEEGRAAREGGEHGFGRSGPRCVEHGAARPVDLARDLGGNAGLAHPIRADERDEARQPAEPPEHVIATDQRRRRRELPRKLERGRLDVERGILAQDRLVQAAELGRRLDPDLVDQGVPRLPVRL